MQQSKRSTIAYLILGLIIGLGLGIGLTILAYNRPQPNLSSTAVTAVTSNQATSAIPAVDEGTDAPKVLLLDAAIEQVLSVATGSIGSSSFSFNPLAGGGDHTAWQTLMWVPPLYFDVDGKLQPGIFTSWQANEDFTEWIFDLDLWARWSDGSPITAADVKGTWELMTLPNTGHGRIPQYLSNVVGYDAMREESATEITGLQILDDQTLRVQLKKPDVIFHWRIATTYMNPVKIEQALLDPQGFWLPENTPAVSGPYMLESYKPDAGEATMVPNPHWWREEGPYLDRITFQFVPNQAAVARLVENEQVDAAMAGLPLDMAADYPDYFRPVTAIGFNSFWLAATVEPTDDLNVRKALILAVDIDEVFARAYQEAAGYPEGSVQRATQMLDPDVSCYDTENVWYDYDPDAARAALAASKYGSAENLPKLRVTPRSTDLALNTALLTVLEFWEQNLGITNVAFATQPGDFGLEESRINLSRDDVVIRFPDGASYAWVGAHSQGPIARGSMMRGYENKQVDALLDEALSLPIDDPRRCELTQKAQQLFMEDYQGLFVAVPERFINASAKVKNYQQGPDVALIEPWKLYMTE